LERLAWTTGVGFLPYSGNLDMRPSQVLVSGVSGPELTNDEIHLFRKIQPGGFILFTRNIVDPWQTRQLTDSLRDLCEETPLIAIDNEGGRVWRTAPFSPACPSAAVLGRLNKPKLIAEAGWITGRLLSILGINLNLAPVLDLDHHPGSSNALNGRCWGAFEQDVINHAGVFNRWQRRQGIAGCAKHFPCGGRAAVDPHHTLPTVQIDQEEILREDIIPYTALMPELDAIMVSHLHFPQIDRNGLPASLSSNIIKRLLRDRLGFDHQLVLTDDLDMGAIQQTYGTPEAARMSIEAGGDLVLLCHQFMNAEESIAQLEKISPSMFYDIEIRIERAKKRLKIPPPYSEEAFATIMRDLSTLRESVPLEESEHGSGENPASPVENY
tara:strand:- start:1855 stop:3003 length:1149 start_codon:yes stop_codon:yes gene_type:complete